jgi:4-hydroxy-3-methylbut-2-enyl diphosphate reductase
MDAALETCARFGGDGPVQTLGPLIHNPQALDHLSRRGVVQVGASTDLRDGTVIIRAHGVPLEDLRFLTDLRRNRRIRITNGTCPAVARVQSLVRRHAAKGGFVIILGQYAHAEVVAHRSFATAGCCVVETLAEAEAIPQARLEGALVVAQTTFSSAALRELSELLRRRCPGISIRDTICPDTHLRQAEARELCGETDALVVVGGKDSNNTRHLVETVRLGGRPVQWVESAAEVEVDAFRGLRTVAVLAGASTPNWTVDEVVEALERAGGASFPRLAARFCRTLQVPLALGLALVTLVLQRRLGWPSGWPGPVLAGAFHLASCALLPYLDPLGLDAKGQLQAQFLERQRALLLGFGVAMGLLALVAAGFLGGWTLAGTVALGVLVLAYQRLRLPLLKRRIPAIKDLGGALIPLWLAVVLPGWRFGSSEPAVLTLAGLVLFALAFAAHAHRHLSAFQEDRILGREILPMVIGSRATRWLVGTLGLLGTGALGWMML